MEHYAMTSLDIHFDEPMSPIVRQILSHLCEGENRGYGTIIEWCESRGDCSQAVACPHCSTQFLLDDDEMAELRRCAARTDEMLACGVIFEH